MVYCVKNNILYLSLYIYNGCILPVIICKHTILDDSIFIFIPVFSPTKLYQDNWVKKGLFLKESQPGPNPFRL